MPVPTNLSAATALVIPSLPYSVTLDAFEVPSDSLWFRYDKVVGGYVVLGAAIPVPLMTGTYIPRIDVWWDNGGTLEPYLDILSFNKPITVPVDDPLITSFYFEVRQSGGGAFTEQLTFQLEQGATLAAPAGSFAINDDTEKFPMAILSIAGEVVQSFTFPAGERAGMTADGYSLWEQNFPNSAFLYNPQFQLIAEVPWDLATTNAAETPISASPSTLYLADPGRFSAPTRNARVTTVTTTGALGPTIWDLGAYFVWAIAPSRDDTILYYVSDSNNEPIKRWDLINDVALSDLAPAPGGSTPMLRDILVLDDGSVVTGYKPAGTSYMRRYSAAGALLNTYTSAVGVALNRLAPSSVSGTFWAWSFITGGAAQFDLYRASDGVILSSFMAPVNVGGVLESPSPNEPIQGLSFSCPFLEIPEPLPAQFFSSTPPYGPIPPPPDCPGIRGAPLPGV